MAITITTDQVKELRQRTGAGVLDAKNTLTETGGDMAAAAQLLRERGQAKAAKKADRQASQGHVIAYVHGDPGRVGVLLEINCETDFVARTEAFRQLAHDLTLQIAAAGPQWVTEEDIPADVVELERHTARAQLAEEKKPPEILDRIVDGKLSKWKDEVVLLRQPFIRDDKVTVSQLVTAAIAEMGENIVVRRFVRYELGERA
jgi:elongation factor Ts